jgi:hypothetical protein
MAYVAASIHERTRNQGISLADCACIAGLAGVIAAVRPRNKLFSDRPARYNSASRAPNVIRVFASVASQSPKRRVGFGALSGCENPSTAARSALVAIGVVMLVFHSCRPIGIRHASITCRGSISCNQSTAGYMGPDVADPDCGC